MDRRRSAALSIACGYGAAHSRAPRPSLAFGSLRASLLGALRACACYPAAVQLTVVIPALDEAEQITGAIASAGAAGCEIIVVDGGSRDGTPERAAAAGARVVAARPGRARQLAAGARLAKGDTILFLHADTRLPEDWDEQRAVGARRPARGGRRLPPALRAALAGAAADRMGHPPARRAAAPAVRRPGPLRAPRGRSSRWAAFRRSRSWRTSTWCRRSSGAAGSLCLPLPATTSARRYRSAGALRTVLRNAAAVAGWWLGLPRERIAAWVRR